MAGEVSELLAEVADIRRRIAGAQYPGVIEQVRGDRVRVRWGSDSRGQPVLSPWLETSDHRGGARVRRFYRPGQNVVISTVGGELNEAATVSADAPNLTYPAPDQADAAGAASETYQLERLHETRKSDCYELFYTGGARYEFCDLRLLLDTPQTKIKSNTVHEGAFSVQGVVRLSPPLAVSEGGSGSTTAAGAPWELKGQGGGVSVGGSPPDAPNTGRLWLNTGTGNLNVWDGESWRPLGGVGEKGDPGEAATITIGTVTSGAPPSVTNSGTATDAILNFVLQPGERGADGAPGAPGLPGQSIIGPMGPAGPPGAAGIGVPGADGRDGRDGVDGLPGIDGRDGINGIDGADGVTPHIGPNGNWFIGTTDTGIPASGGGISVTIDVAPPASPIDGSLWFDSTDLQTSIFYDGQWVPVVHQARGGNALVYIDTDPPLGALAGSLWLDSTDLQTSVFYNDQWIPVVHQRGEGEAGLLGELDGGTY